MAWLGKVLMVGIVMKNLTGLDDYTLSGVRAGLTTLLFITNTLSRDFMRTLPVQMSDINKTLISLKRTDMLEPFLNLLIS